MLSTVVAFSFVFAVLAVAAYALIRPLTHTHYQRSSGKLWQPLD